MEYNSTRNKLVMPEYGRNVQKMIRNAMTIEDREKRSRIAKAIVNIMASMNPKVKESADYKQKLWDHLIIISDFKLDVDSPYPYPDQHVLKSRPRKLNYKKNPMRFRHYGRNIERIIAKAIALPDGEEKEALIQIIANHLKKSYLNWNRDSVNDELIYKHFEELSGGDLKLDEDFKFHETSEILGRNRRKKFVGKRDNNPRNRPRRSNN